MTPATCIVGIVILIAAVYMFKHVRGLFKGTTGCSCATAAQAAVRLKKIRPKVTANLPAAAENKRCTSKGASCTGSPFSCSDYLSANVL
ncbi:hypothetical protein HMPREF0080_00940 [Anaeroglobus geminatus F0357]|uniref:FeoB-associated Cys-rich membrane protein n=1 Tax=Anaeroglobus geminatus F0357 TaxID=861450 RepID=G9YH15_9FIRM|nr:hypothetical protein HMPREF0080_00940 [Anaeroglobus geminatus F0357]